jgi:hypothetical protein
VTTIKKTEGQICDLWHTIVTQVLNVQNYVHDDDQVLDIRFFFLSAVEHCNGLRCYLYKNRWSAFHGSSFFFSPLPPGLRQLERVLHSLANNTPKMLSDQSLIELWLWRYLLEGERTFSSLEFVHIVQRVFELFLARLFAMTSRNRGLQFITNANFPETYAVRNQDVDRIRQHCH